MSNVYNIRTSRIFRKQNRAKTIMILRKESRHRPINQSSYWTAEQADRAMIYFRPTTCVHVIIIIITAFFDTYLKAIGIVHTIQIRLHSLSDYNSNEYSRVRQIVCCGERMFSWRLKIRWFSWDLLNLLPFT